MKTLTKAFKIFFRFVAPAVLVLLYFLKTLVLPDKRHLEIMYTISLSACMGYFTNFIAIKMLFRPKKETFFKRQGVIPKNQEILAKSFGEGISSNFFEANDLTNYITENRVVEKLITQIKKYLSNKIQENYVQQAIKSWLLRIFRLNSAKTYDVLIQFSEKNFPHFLQRNINFRTALGFLSETIENNINNNNINLVQISRTISSHIESNIPHISNQIYQQIQAYIDQQRIVQKATIRFATWLNDFDRLAVETQLHTMVVSTEFQHEVYQQLETGIRKITEYINSEEGADKASQYFEKTLIDIHKVVEEKGIPWLMEKIESFLEEDSSWNKLEPICNTLINFAEQELKNLTNSEEFSVALGTATPIILNALDISAIVTEKVRTLDTNQLEKMILDATGEHLGKIEVLGGILGAIMGIALFNIKLFISIMAGLIVLALIEQIFTSEKNE